ncbi:hypothetical protein RR46_03288 [Papilio xuthus]|uniref:Uncharacterized protein n=1 Tax=Papilio xuthus TaxID=66420 RepID=A0A194QGP5_PAPXU|nr:hypothetical protein RR46_03288 [Papilio xuthus]
MRIPVLTGCGADRRRRLAGFARASEREIAVRLAFLDRHPLVTEKRSVHRARGAGPVRRWAALGPEEVVSSSEGRTSRQSH